MSTDTPRREREQPWVMRTYSGHSSAFKSNELYRSNLAKGQTGLSVAFDLPTQTGYDADDPRAQGEVGKVGVPIGNLEDMSILFDQIPLEKMNTSMTINATAAWLLSLYVALAEKRGLDPKVLSGTTQNDIIKEYLSRGTYVFPPEPSIRCITDMITYTVEKIPKWNPTNICSYHLQEAGATPVQELAYAICNAIAILDAVKATGRIAEKDMGMVVGRISFFVNAGIRFVEEMCKMRGFTEMWDKLTLERYGVQDEKFRRFRYGVQVNSLGLTESQPENNVPRIILEMLSVVLSKDARARAVQLPAWNEALGLPRPWDQQWSLRIQQIIAFETDLLEYGDMFNGSPVIAEKVRELVDGAQQEIDKVLEMGVLEAVESGYIKERLVESNRNRLQAIERGDLTVVGVNKYTEGEPSPLTQGVDSGIMKVDPQAEREQIERLRAFRAKRSASDVEAAIRGLKDTAKNGSNIMPASIAAAHAGVTTGEWAGALREVFGEYRAPTGVARQTLHPADTDAAKAVQKEVEELSAKLGRRLKILVGKPGLDGHSNGAEQIAVKARDVGMEVVYEGIRLTPEQIVNAALEEGVHVIGLSILSGSHDTLVPQILTRMREVGLTIPVVVGGIIPPDDEVALIKAGVARVYTPKNFELNGIMQDIVHIVASAQVAEAVRPKS
jgi:ethylmalonyl-CoA mutase